MSAALLPNLPAQYNQVTLRFPLRYGLPCMFGSWQRLPDGKLQATFTQEEIQVLSAWGVFDLVPPEFVDESVSKSIWNPQPTAAQRRRI
jgi:hypothetical protein